MSTTPETHTEAEYQEILGQRDRLARDVIWAVNFMDCKGGGLIASRKPDGGHEMTHWLTRFRKDLAALGVEWDDDLLDYGRASNTNRKKMLKEVPGLADKLAKAMAA